MAIVRITDVGAGVIKDQPDHDLPESPLVWSDVTNMGFAAGQAERVMGYAAAFDTTPTQALYGLLTATTSAGVVYLVGLGTNKAHTYTGTTENEITGPTIAATADTKWTGGVLTGFVVVNESTVAPQYIAISALGGATNLADLTNWPASTTCKVLRPFRYFLVAGNMTESSTAYPYKVRWSTAAAPGALPASWVATTSNDAGSVDLSADDGVIVDMLPIGDMLAIYREQGIWMMRYVGGTDAVNRLVMSFQRVPVGSNAGMLGNNCGVDVAGVGHVVMSATDVYVFDGTQVRSILTNKMRRWLFETIHPTLANRKRSFLINVSADNEVWVCFPEAGKDACTKALIWNYSDNTFGIRDLPNATAGVHAVVADGGGTYWNSTSLTQKWNTITGSWQSYSSSAGAVRKTVLASTDNKIYSVGNGDSKNGSTLTAELKREYISFGDAQRVKFIRSVWPRFDGITGQQLSISVGVSMSVNETPSWQTEQTFTVGSTRKLDVNRSGRFMGLRIRSTTGSKWRLRSLDVDVQPQGLW